MQKPAFIYAAYPTATTAAATGMVNGQTAADILQADEDTYISPATNTITITIDMQTAHTIGCFGIAGEDINGITVEVRASTDNFSGSNIAASAAATISGFIAAWRSFTGVSYRYWRLIITNATTSTRIYHAALAPFNLLPYLDDGADIDKFSSDCTHLISPQGHFLGSQKLKTELKITITPGKISGSEYTLFLAWATSCVRSPQGFFFIPDTSTATCYFGYTDPKYTFSAPMKAGVRSLTGIPFTSRLP